VKEGNLDKQGHATHGWNEAEIFILAILVGEISILGEKKFYYDMNILIFEGYQFRSGDEGESCENKGEVYEIVK